MLGRALVAEPDLLLLDEPTNHLDIEAITWLEEMMAQFAGALLFVSHDRAFVRRLASRIVDLDRGQLRDWPGSYDDFVLRKRAALVAQQRPPAFAGGREQQQHQAGEQQHHPPATVAIERPECGVHVVHEAGDPHLLSSGRVFGPHGRFTTRIQQT